MFKASVPRTAVMVMATATALIGFAAAPASAADRVTCGNTYHKEVEYPGGGGMRPCGIAEFTPNAVRGAEVLMVCDWSRDGHSADMVYYRSDTGRWESLWGSSGYNTCTYEEIEMASGASIRFKVCAGESETGAILSSTCSSYLTVRA
ncbi:hypothetical protein ACFYWX_39635 [Streptomyces sp. NPDC002888]|uniref:hypothetical protein n=1 Tax=Streptomyces sp. NPDC002888 TaxID=3364668 RepID=UPI0036B5CBF4